MEAKEDLSIKTRLFSLYLGQNIVGNECDRANFKLYEISDLDSEVGIWGDWSGGTNPERSCNDVVSIKDVWLNLKSVTNITINDLIKCYHSHSGIIGYDYTQDFKSVDVMAKHWIEKDGFKVLENHSKIVDYLRSKGYALPFLGIEIEEQINFGWIKIINN